MRLFARARILSRMAKTLPHLQPLTSLPLVSYLTLWCRTEQTYICPNCGNVVVYPYDDMVCHESLVTGECNTRMNPSGPPSVQWFIGDTPIYFMPGTGGLFRFGIREPGARQRYIDALRDRQNGRRPAE